MELSTSNILSLFQTDKSQRLSFVNQIMEGIENGTASPLKVHLQIRGMEDIINSLTNTDPKKNKNYEIAMRYKKLLLDEAEKNGNKFTLHNAEFSISESVVKYFYDKCGDNELNELVAQMEVLKEKIDQKQTFLKNIPIEGVDIRQGDELVRVYPAYKKSSSCVKVFLK